MGIGKKILILFSLFVLESQAFVSVSCRCSISTKSEASLTTALSAKKKRRIRKNPGEGSPSPSSAAETPFGNDDELPDFDLEPMVAQEDSPSSKKSSSSSFIDGEAPITNAQMGRIKPMSSLSDLLNDRSLESALPFEEPVDAEPLPSFAEYKATVKKAPPTVVGNQKARQEAREAARAAEEEANNGFFSNLPFLGGGGKTNGEKSDISPIKLLENGTWVGIFILVAWEIYINSPLFERAGPMAPIVYDKLPM